MAKARRRLGAVRVGVAVLLGALGLGAAGMGVLWVQERERLLGEEPPRRSSTLTLPERESRVVLRLDLPFALLRRAALEAVPASLTLRSPPGAGTRHEVTIRRVGDIALSAAGNRLRVTAALAVEGDVGLGGALADLLSLGRKNIDAAAEVQADLGLTLDDGWCPAWSVAVTYRWLRMPRLEVIGGVWVGIEEQVRAQAEAALRDLPAQLAALLPCRTVREQALALWQPRSVAVQLPAAPPLHLTVRPQSIGLSEIAAAPGALNVMLGLRAVTAITSRRPPEAPPAFLPPLHALPERWQERDGRLRVAIPVRAGYDMIRDWLMREFGGRDIPFETPLGPVRLRVREIFLYPSDPALAMAVTFDASLPGLLPDTTGRVVFSARPVLGAGGTRVGLEDLRFVRDLDSRLWSLATLVFERQIREWLEGIAVYDLREVMDGALEALRELAADPANTGGLRVTLTRPELRLERLVPELDALAVLGSAEAGVEAELTSLPLP